MNIATTVEEYLADLPADQRAAIGAVRDAINARLPAGYVEVIQYGMIGWTVPESVLPATDVYNGQPLCLASLGAQKNHMALYMLGVYGDPEEKAWFEAAFKQAGKKLDMGKSCVRFKTLDALPLDVVAEAMSRISVDKYVAAYRAIRAAMKSAPSGSSTTTAPTRPAPPAKPIKPTKPAKAKAVAAAKVTKPAAKPVAQKAAKKPAAKPVAPKAAKKPAAKPAAKKPAAKPAKQPAKKHGK